MPYRGVITYVRIKEGTLPSDARIRMFATHVESEAEETGVNAPGADAGARRSVPARSATS